MFNEDMGLDEIILFEDDSEVVEEEVPELELPCLVIKGAILEEEEKFLSERPFTDGLAIKTYFDVSGYIKPIGYIDMTLDNILLLKYLNYELFLHLPDGDVKSLNTPDLYLNFIKAEGVEEGA